MKNDFLYTYLRIESTKSFVYVCSMLAQGTTINVTALIFRIGRSTMQKILVEVCQAITEVLIPIYMPKLDQETWKKISNEFEIRWNIPHCLGALDGKHFELKKPPGSGSIFFNYKKYFSMVLLALCDAHRRFTWFNIGHYGMNENTCCCSQLPLVNNQLFNKNFQVLSMTPVYSCVQICIRTCTEEL